MNRLIILVFLGCLSISQLCDCQETLKNREIYTFQSRGDLGFLTTHLNSPVVDTDSWRDAASQKFRIIKGIITNNYMLKPTSEEGESVYATSSKVSKASSGLGFSSSQYWTMIPVEKPFFQIQNLDSQECLESHGLGQKVSTKKCRNVPAQQWAMHSH